VSGSSDCVEQFASSKKKDIVVAISLAREIVDADDWTDVLERRQQNAPAGSDSGSRKGRVSRAR